MRLFFAIELDAGVAGALDLAVSPLREREPGISWSPPEKWHLTMKFVGEGDEGAAARLAAAADRVAALHSRFEMSIGGLGAFPNFRRARVVWVGVRADARLELLHHDLEVHCGAEGFEVEGRAFRPHITIARLRAPLGLDRARPLARAARDVAFTATQEVAGVTLFESTLAPAGAGYRRVHAAPMGGG